MIFVCPMLSKPKLKGHIATDFSISKLKTGKQLRTTNNRFTDHFRSGRDLATVDEILGQQGLVLLFCDLACLLGLKAVPAK